MLLLIILLAILIISLLSFGIGYLISIKDGKLASLSKLLVSFAAGTMLSVALLDMLPEALEALNSEELFIYVLLGVVGFFFMERFVLWYHHHDCDHCYHPSAYLVLVGDSIHNFIDGVAIAAAFMVDFTLGVSTTFAIFMHEVPQEIADFGVLLHSGFSKTKALLYNFLSSLSAILGGLVAFFFLSQFENFMSIALSLGAGMFIYIACSDLIPEMHKEANKSNSFYQFIPFILGLAGIYLLGTLLHP